MERPQLLVGAVATGAIAGASLYRLLANKQRAPQPTSLELVYFDIEGRGEPIRLACAVGNVPLIDTRITRADRGLLFEKPKKEGAFPFGQLPILKVTYRDKKEPVVLSQSMAILRYVGQHGGLYPTCHLKAALLDQCMMAIYDIQGIVSMTIHPQRSGWTFDPEQSFVRFNKKSGVRQKLNNAVLPRHLCNLEKVIAANNKAANSTGYILGDTLTVADLLLYVVARFLSRGLLDGISKNILEPFPHILKVADLCKKLPSVKKYEAARKAAALR